MIDWPEWLEDFADRNMAGGNEYGGPLPWAPPEGLRGLRKEVTVEFRVTLADGTEVTTTRPLAYKDGRST
jgi:hypothetical protein